jgi:adenylate cyclase
MPARRPAPLHNPCEPNVSIHIRLGILSLTSPLLVSSAASQSTLILLSHLTSLRSSTMTPTTKFSTQNLTKLYITSLATIAALSIGGQIIIQHQLTRQSKDVTVLNAAQDRKQLCEKLLKMTMASRLAIGEERTAAIQELVQVLKTWENSQQDLKQQMQKTLSPQDLAEIEPTIAKLKPLATEILTAAKLTINADAAPIPPGLTRRNPLRNPALPNPAAALSIPRLIKTGTEFNQEIDNLIRWYSQKAEDGVSRLKMLEFGLLGLTLGTLLLEGLLVFRPAIAKLKESLQTLEKTLYNLAQEQEKSEKLLLNILPEPIADRLKQRPQAIADGFAEATVLFADIVGFTELSSRLSPQELVQCLNEIFSCFDRLAEKHGLEKIKTIGDAYMVVGGLPNPRPDHAVAVARMALEMQTELQALNRSMGEKFDIRIGINTGPVVAGVIGIKKFIYDLWGDTVNIASRMESHGEPGAIHISEATHRHLSHEFDCQSRGSIPIKGKGQMQTYWLKQRQTIAPNH